MKISPIKTNVIGAKEYSLKSFVDEYVHELDDESVLVVTSKVVALCEGAVRAKSEVTKDELIREEAELVLLPENTRYGITFTIKNHMITPTAGIDESNAGDVYVLLPRDPQTSANRLREYLVKKFQVENVGVVITDSTSRMLQRGTTGVCLAHSGFRALNSYVGKPDLFGREMKVSASNVAQGLAAAAVVTMGEGAERTPLSIITDVSFVQFQKRNPSEDELHEIYIELDDDIFSPFLKGVEWEKGDFKTDKK